MAVEVMVYVDYLLILIHRNITPTLRQYASWR